MHVDMDSELTWMDTYMSLVGRENTQGFERRRLRKTEPEDPRRLPSVAAPDVEHPLEVVDHRDDARLRLRLRGRRRSPSLSRHRPTAVAMAIPAEVVAAIEMAVGAASGNGGGKLRRGSSSGSRSGSSDRSGNGDMRAMAQDDRAQHRKEM